MSWVESHHTPRALWVERIGSHTPVRGKFRGAVEETLFEDCAPSTARYPPLVLRTSIVTITLHGNCCHLGNHKERRAFLHLKQKTISHGGEKYNFTIMCYKYVFVVQNICFCLLITNLPPRDLNQREDHCRKPVFTESAGSVCIFLCVCVCMYRRMARGSLTTVGQLEQKALFQTLCLF